MSLQPGTKVKHYLINDLIATGGMGVVWHAWDFAQNESVAIKAVSSDLVFNLEINHTDIDPFNLGNGRQDGSLSLVGVNARLGCKDKY